MLVGPRVRVGARPRCDEDDECECPPADPVGKHPIVIAVVVAFATAAAQALGEIFVKRMTATSDEQPASAEVDDQPKRKARR